MLFLFFVFCCCFVVLFQVSTHVGEEGLDIGEVDIVVHYDMPQSVLRNVQRSGRTGRKRVGRVVYLLSTRSEKTKFKQMKRSKKAISKIKPNQYQYYQHSPRMFPSGFDPSLKRIMLIPPAKYIPRSERKKLKYKSMAQKKKSVVCLYIIDMFGSVSTKRVTFAI